MKYLIEAFQWLVLFLMSLMAGCSWQGQRHYEYLDGEPRIAAEAWSMRFCWVSSGLELYDETPYWTAGALVRESRPDPNAVSAVAAGAVAGLAPL